MREFCRRRFPSLPVFPVPVMVDTDVFHFQSEKRMQIVFSPRKRPTEAAFVQDLFRAENPEFRNVPWIELSGASQETVARVLKDSAIYLSLSRFESAALSILEAMACGCAVAGFTGFGAREYTSDGNGFWAAEDDCLDCTDQLARAVRLVTDGGTSYREMLEAANMTANQFGRERFAKRIVEFWRAYLEGGEFPKLFERGSAATRRKQTATAAPTPHCFLRSSGTPIRIRPWSAHLQKRVSVRTRWTR